MSHLKSSNGSMFIQLLISQWVTGPTQGLAQTGQRDVYLTVQGDNPSSVVRTIQPLPVWTPPTLITTRGSEVWFVRLSSVPAQYLCLSSSQTVWSVFWWFTATSEVLMQRLRSHKGVTLMIWCNSFISIKETLSADFSLSFPPASFIMRHNISVKWNPL